MIAEDGGMALHNPRDDIGEKNDMPTSIRRRSKKSTSN
jgi:hypothetical protein